MKQATRIFEAYARDFRIDYILFPVECGAQGVKIAIVEPATISANIEGDSPMVERRKDERFARMVRKYSVIKAAPYLKPVALIPTRYSRVKDFPVHVGMRARGFEVVCAEAFNLYFGEGDSVHTGDKLNEVDVISKHFGRCECKIGAGKLHREGKKKK